MKPWEQRPNEGSAAFGLFRRFLELGSDRDLASVSIDTDRKLSTVKRISKKFTWVIRARAYDAYLAKVELDAAKRRMEANAVKWVQRFEQLRESEFQAGLDLLAKAQKMLQFPLSTETVIHNDGPMITDEHGNQVPTHTTTIIINPIKHSAKDIPTYYDTASKLMRLALGKETERKVLGIEAKTDIDKARALYDQLMIEYADRPEVLEMLPQWLAQQWGVSPKELEAPIIEGEIIEPLSSSAEQ